MEIMHTWAKVFLDPGITNATKSQFSKMTGVNRIASKSKCWTWFCYAYPASLGWSNLVGICLAWFGVDEFGLVWVNLVWYG